MFGRLAMGFANVRAGTRVLTLVLVQARLRARGVVARLNARHSAARLHTLFRGWRRRVRTSRAVRHFQERHARRVLRLGILVWRQACHAHHCPHGRTERTISTSHDTILLHTFL